MKRVISMFVVLMMVGALCVGCKKADTATPKPAGQPTEKKVDVEGNNAKNWEPETKKETPPPTTGGHDPHDGHDHTGHSH